MVSSFLNIFVDLNLSVIYWFFYLRLVVDLTFEGGKLKYLAKESVEYRGLGFLGFGLFIFISKDLGLVR